MPSPDLDLQSGLQEILDRILAGQIDEVQLKDKLDEFLADQYQEREPVIRDLVQNFCSGLVDRLRSDSLSFRVALLAELACRLNQWVGSGPDPLTAFCAERLIRLKDYGKALSIIERILTVRSGNSSTCDRLLEALRTACLNHLSRFAEADRYVSDYELKYQPLPNDQTSIEMLCLGAWAALELSSTERADRRASHAISMFERLRDAHAATNLVTDGFFPPLSSSRLRTIYGQIVRQSGDILRSIEEFQLGRDDGKAEGDVRGAAICLSEIGISWERAGEVDRGARILSQAAEEAEACGETQLAMRWRNMAVVDAEGRRSLSGFDGLAFIATRVRSEKILPDDEVITIAKNIIVEARGSSQVLESMARNALAGIYALLRQFNQAIAQLTVAIQIADSAGDKWFGIIFRANLANTSFRAGHFAQAEEAAQEALDRAKIYARIANSSEVRQAVAVAVANASEVLFMLWGLEWSVSTGEIRGPSPDKIVILEQQVRSGNFDRWMTLTNFARSEAAEQAHQNIRELIEAEIAVEAAAQVGESLSAPVRALERASRVLESGYPALWHKRLLDERRPGLAEAINSLSENDIVLDFNPVQSGIVCIVAGKQRKAEVFEIPWDRDARAKWNKRWHYVSDGAGYRLSRRRARRSASDAKIETCNLEVREQSKAALADLDERFLGPLYKHIGAGPTRIICVTHTELFGIPLWSLDRVVCNLVLSVVPSIASISLLANLPASRSTRFLKIGDATGTLEMVPRELAALSSFEAVEPERTMLSRKISGARQVHFAGHGEFLETNPYASGVVVGGAVSNPYTVADPDERCARLTLQGLIHDWDLKGCDLVVLSACSTGIPRSHGASEFTSVSTTLLLAGARNVIAASWPADDVATMLLMQKFYEALKDHPSPARALAEARRSILMMNREAALALVENEELLPSGERPFSLPFFTDTFLHFGID